MPLIGNVSTHSTTIIFDTKAFQPMKAHFRLWFFFPVFLVKLDDHDANIEPEIPRWRFGILARAVWSEDENLRFEIGYIGTESDGTGEDLQGGEVAEHFVELSGNVFRIRTVTLPEDVRQYNFHASDSESEIRG
jgi:hypothetical protein